MVRPVRKGLAYFPLDTDLFQNRKIQRLSRRYGCRGVAVYLALLCEIYGTNGYYIPYSDDLFFDLGFTLALDEGEVKQIADFCIELNLFDKPMKEAQRILTSQSIQDRFRLVRKKGVLYIPPAFCLTDDATPVAEPEDWPGGATAPVKRITGETERTEGPYGTDATETEYSADRYAGKKNGAAHDKPAASDEAAAFPAVATRAEKKTAGTLSPENVALIPINAPLKERPSAKAAKTHPKGKEKVKVKEKKVNELVKSKNYLENGTGQTDNEGDMLRREELARMADEATRRR